MLKLGTSRNMSTYGVHLRASDNRSPELVLYHWESIAVTGMKTKICIVQPIQSPYWTDRLKALVRNEELDLVLILERESFAHRPGWIAESIPGLSLVVLNSYVGEVEDNIYLLLTHKPKNTIMTFCIKK